MEHTPVAGSVSCTCAADAASPSSHATIEVVMTAAFMAAMPPIVFYVFLQRYIIQGIALTGLKG